MTCFSLKKRGSANLEDYGSIVENYSANLEDYGSIVENYSTHFSDASQKQMQMLSMNGPKGTRRGKEICGSPSALIELVSQL